jgi:D-alanyl-lipoteichoic acid acyltransferase DltB (MBOAT superfamily)
MAIAMTANWIGGTRGFVFDVTYVMLVCGGFALLVSGLMLVSPARVRQIGEWILLGTAALAVVLASDLVNKLDNGTVGVKLVMIALVAGALKLSDTLAVLQVEESQMARRQELAGLGKFLSIAVQLGFLVLLIRHFNLVSPVFCHQIIFLTLYGFLLHYFLPLRYRLPFFLFLSLSGIVFIFGFVQAGWLIGIGLILIGLCHLPIRFYFRVGLLVLAGVALAEFRAGRMQSPWSGAIWPILGSMFMFRLIVYMYSLKHQKAPVGVWPSLSYFFLLPNVVFPLFPVVDYTTFHRTYYDADRHLIHQTGVKWIFRGITHLLLYRYIYYYVVIGPEEVDSVTNLVRYMVSGFLLILKLSGQFHLIVGMLHLFGFNLPETMNRYFLASSFTDLWRRANIYWRDFMQRVVFYPVYFPLRMRTPTTALLCATLVVFFVTWALHSYQWFWLRGSFSFSAPDVLFWTLFGLLVVINTLYEAKHGRKREMAKRTQTWGEIVSLALRTVGTFCVICVLWSLWISTSVSEWLSLWSVPGITWKDITILAPALIGAIIVAGWAGATSRTENQRGPTALGAGPAQPSFFPSAALTGSLILLLFLVSQPIVYSQLGVTLREGINDLRTDRLNEQDLTLLTRGYYENLTRVNRFNSQLWELYNKQPNDEPLSENTKAQPKKDMPAEQPNNGPLSENTKAQPKKDMPAEQPDDGSLLEDMKPSRPTGDFLTKELRPSIAIVVKGKQFHTNRWGMRDKDYEMKPPPGTCRIALLGSSPEMGSGVADDQVWEKILEDRLNRENDRKRISQYEILNFSVGGHSLLERLKLLETKVLSFDPDIVFYVAHTSDQVMALHHLAKAATRETEIPYDYLRQVVHEAGIEGERNIAVASRGLQPYGNDIMSWTYRRTVELCHQHAIVPVFIFLPNFPGSHGKELPAHLHLAKEAGFLIVDPSDIYGNEDKASLQISEWDGHPNAVAHKLIADRLYKELKSNPALLQKLK